jgi:hypothetical protein
MLRIPAGGFVVIGKSTGDTKDGDQAPAGRFVSGVLALDCQVRYSAADLKTGRKPACPAQCRDGRKGRFEIRFASARPVDKGRQTVAPRRCATCDTPDERPECGQKTVTSHSVRSCSLTSPRSTAGAPGCFLDARSASARKVPPSACNSLPDARGKAPPDRGKEHPPELCPYVRGDLFRQRSRSLHSEAKRLFLGRPVRDFPDKELCPLRCDDRKS